jgi:hypothetical protein
MDTCLEGVGREWPDIIVDQVINDTRVKYSIHNNKQESEEKRKKETQM